MMQQLQHRYITTTATIISDIRAWANGTDNTAVPRDDQPTTQQQEEEQKTIHRLTVISPSDASGQVLPE